MTQTHEIKPDEKGSDDERRFVAPGGAAFAPTHPMVAELLTQLRAGWPEASPCDAILDAFPDRDLPRIVLSLFQAGIVELRTSPPRCLGTVSDRPVVSALTRKQSRESSYATNQLHHPVKLDDDTARFLLPLLDGSRDIQTLAGDMEAAVLNGRLKMEYRGKPLQEHVGLTEMLPQFVRFHLNKIRELALLVG